MMTLLRLKKNLFWEKGQWNNEQQKNVITSQEERAQNYHYKSRRKSSKLYKNKTQNKHFYRK